MLVRALTESDAIVFWDLRLKSLADKPESFGASFEEEASKPIENRIDRYKNNYIFPPNQDFIMGAFNENGDLVGMVGLHRKIREKLRHKGNVWGMYVLPEFRQKGIGKLLLSELLNKSKLLEGLEQVNLSVVSKNLNAIRLYTYLGFKSYGLEKNALKIGDQYFDEEYMVFFI